jgi:cell division protein FtsB
MTWQNLWTRLQSLGFLVFAGIVGFGVVLLFVPLLRIRHIMLVQISLLDKDIARQESLEKQQNLEIEALKTDIAYVEQTARNKLNLARSNEIIFRFEPKPAPAPVRNVRSNVAKPKS